MQIATVVGGRFCGRSTARSTSRWTARAAPRSARTRCRGSSDSSRAAGENPHTTLRARNRHEPDDSTD